MTQAEKDELVARVVTATNAHTDWKLLQLIAYLRNTGVKCAPAGELGVGSGDGAGQDFYREGHRVLGYVPVRAESCSDRTKL